MPRLPRETKMDVTKRHACHAKCRGVTGDQSSPSAPPEPAQRPKCHACHAKRRWMSPSVALATRNEGGCRQAPRMPRKVDVSKSHACHVKRRCMSRSAMPAMQSGTAPRATPSATSATPDNVANVHKCHACHMNEGGCHQVPRLPRKTKVDVSKCHACHVKRRWMSPSATLATQSDAAPRATNGARHQVQQVPHLPRQTQVNVNKCHACHMKRRWMSPSATPAPQNEGGCLQVPRLPRFTNKVCERCCVKDGV